MKTNPAFVFLILVVLLQTACSNAATPSPTPTSTLIALSSEEMINIFNTFFDALNAGDIEPVMSLVAEDARLCFEGCVSTTDTIRQSIQGQINNGYRHETIISRIEGDSIYFFHRVYTGDRLIIKGDDILVIENGKIKSLKGF